MKTKKYDFIFSIGEACSCTQILRHLGLQNASYPFDWLFGSTFIGRCKILTEEFKDFIRKEDLEYSHEERSLKCNAYYNKLNDIVFNHDFLKSLDFEDAYPLVKEKYDRRIRRLLEKIKNSNSVLAVYLEIPTTNHVEVTNEEILQGYSILKEKFGDKINLLYIKNSKCETKIERFENDKIIKVIGDYKKIDTKLDYKVKKMKLVSIFNKIGFNRWFYICKNEVLRFLINNFIYSENLKERCKRYFHI